MEELRDLKKIYDDTNKRFNQYEGRDFILPEIFKERVKEINSNTITYNKYSAVIKTKGSQNGVLNIYLPNQWFYIASYFTDLYNELQRYKKAAIKVVEQKERLKTIKERNELTLTEQEEKRLQEMNLTETSKENLRKFITNYTWWNGAKTIERGDFYVSPILNSAKLVNASQSFVADLCAFLSDKADLVKAIITGEDLASKEKHYAIHPIPLQQIFYGAPGTGKSNTIKRNVDDQGKTCFRTTFHPDSDYSTFVGTYKPSMKPTGVTLASGEKEEIITYKFIPQAFTKAYAAAWNTTEDVFLVIEEINRGNCAQIFGDLFQLLDRKGGKSEYPIEADTDLANYLQEALAESKRTDIPQDIKSGERLMIPQNLYIWATMNTSDQSLFPIDSAFKRRWDWVYIPIKPHAEENYKIKIGNETYDWWGFLQKMNSVIDDTTHSEDKKLGYFFVNTESKTVCAEKLVSKVLFYLWNDVFKNYGFDHSIFTDNLGVKFTFSDFFNEDGTPNTNRVNDFLKKLDNEIDKDHTFIEITSTETENQGLPNTNE